MVHWPPFLSEVELRSPWSWLGKEKGTKKAGIVAGLVHVQLHGVWRSFQNCDWSCLYLILVLCQLKEIGRCEVVMQSVVLNFSCLSDVLSNVSSLFWSLFKKFSSQLFLCFSLLSLFLFIINTQNFRLFFLLLVVVLLEFVVVVYLFLNTFLWEKLPIRILSLLSFCRMSCLQVY